MPFSTVTHFLLSHVTIDFGGIFNGFRLPGAGGAGIYPTSAGPVGGPPGISNGIFGPSAGIAGAGGGGSFFGAGNVGGGPFGGNFFSRSQVGGSSLSNYNPNLVSDCPTTEYNRTGICVSNPAECRNRGGRIVGQCFANPILGESHTHAMCTVTSTIE